MTRLWSLFSPVLVSVRTSWSGVVINLSPSDCDAKDGDCQAAIQHAVSKCRAEGRSKGCRFMLEPGRYRISCPRYPRQPQGYAYIRTPGAVDLSNLDDIIFGGVAPATPALLDIDYIVNGCPGIAAWNSSQVVVQNVVLDCARLPFSEGVVTSLGDDRRKVELKMREPERGEWNFTKYPWLRDMYSGFLKDHPFNFSGKVSWNVSSGVGVLHYSQPWKGKVGSIQFVKHFVNMQAWGIYGWQVSGFKLVHSTLLSSAGMGFRCDFCEGDYVIQSSAVRPGPWKYDGPNTAARSMSSTADGIHFMHHRGRIIMRDTVINGTGDDCFNTHGNFIVLSSVSPSRLSATYIDETGPGWIPEAPRFLVGDHVRFYNRLTLQEYAQKTPVRLIHATGGYGVNATLQFDNPIPPGVKLYDMWLSAERSPSLDVEGCSFIHGGHGILMSVIGARIVNNYFHNGFTSSDGLSSILALNGGCGAYEDYTEGPFTQDVMIANNTFNHLASGGSAEHRVKNRAIIQFAGCRPVGSCSSAAENATEPYPMPRCEVGGSTQPPVVQHKGDDGPGRITETGEAVVEGMIYKNITIAANIFSLTSASGSFVDIGVSKGIAVYANRMERLHGNAAAVSIYSSKGFNGTEMKQSNICIQGGRIVECHIDTDSSQPPHSDSTSQPRSEPRSDTIEFV